MFPKLAIFDHLRRLGVRLVEATLKSDLELDSGRGGRGDGTVGGFQVERDRFLTKDLLTGRSSSLDQWRVRIGRRPYHDRVDCRVFENIGRIGRNAIAAGQFRQRLRRLELDIADCCQPRAGNLVRDRSGMAIADASGAEHADSVWGQMGSCGFHSFAAKQFQRSAKHVVDRESVFLQQCFVRSRFPVSILDTDPFHPGGTLLSQYFRNGSAEPPDDRVIFSGHDQVRAFGDFDYSRFVDGFDRRNVEDRDRIAAFVQFVCQVSSTRTVWIPVEMIPRSPPSRSSTARPISKS